MTGEGQCDYKKQLLWIPSNGEKEAVPKGCNPLENAPRRFGRITRGHSRAKCPRWPQM